MELIFVRTQCIYPSMTYLCKRPLGLGFVQATGAHCAYRNVQTCIMLWVCSYWKTSVSLSVTPFSPCSHHRIIMKFTGVITMVKSDVHAKGQGQRSKVKVTEVNTQLSRFRTLTPVWIHIWQWSHAHSWKQHRRGAYCFSRSSVKFQGHTALKIVEFDPNWAFPDCNSSLKSPMATKWCTKLEVA